MERPNAHGEYDPLVGIDHAAICSDFFSQTGGHVQQFVQHEYDRQQDISRPAYVTFQKIVKYVHDFDEDGNPLEYSPKKAALNSGVVLGLSLLEYMAEELDIEIDDFYTHWESSSVAVLIDIYGDKYKDASSQEKLEALYEGVKTLGLRHLTELPDAYSELVTRAEKVYGLLDESGESFRAGFGYVVGSGYVAMQYAYERAGMGELDFESLLKQPEQVEEPRPTHQSEAERFIRILTSGDEDTDIATILGLVARDNFDHDERVVQVFHALALAAYTKEGEVVMNDTAEAFGSGLNLGFHIATDIAESEVDTARLTKRWRKNKLHQELLKYGPDYHERTRVDAMKALLHVRSTSVIPHEYKPLLVLIDEELEHDDEDSAAFRDGFQYALATVLKEIQSQKNDDAVSDEMRTFNDELETFMREHDITGDLQEVYTAYLEHCKAFDLDPNKLTEAEGATLLELTIADYNRLMPDMTHLEVKGPCFILEIDSEDENEVSPLLLEEGDVMRGTVDGFKLSVTAADKTYADADSFLIGQFPLRFMPSIVLKDVRMKLADNTEGDSNSRIMVGFVVPGAKYRSFVPDDES